jgi:gluconolactonase
MKPFGGRSNELLEDFILNYYGEIEGASVEILHDDFKPCIVGHARVERLYTGARWSEGPAYFPAHRQLIWSDIPNNRMLRYDETNGQVSVFRNPSNNSNGNTVDAQGRLVTCEHLTRRVTRTEHDGSITIIASHFQGKRFNSPNDVVVHSNGDIWFTDPDYGIRMDYEGERQTMELAGRHVYRVRGEKITQMTHDFICPNGLSFSRDEQYLYVSDTGASHVPNGPRHIRKMRIEGEKLKDEGVFLTCSAGAFDGFRVDSAERIWASTYEGVHIFNPKGELIGKIKIPERVANLTFGGLHKNRLYICGTTSLYALFLACNG